MYHNSSLTVFALPHNKSMDDQFSVVKHEALAALSVVHTVRAAAAAAKTAPSTIETHDSSSIADALLLSLTLGDEVWEVLRDCGFVMMIQLHTKQAPSHSLLWGKHRPLVDKTGKRQG